jgi:transcriptional regulator with XRE-family HTH domain
MAPADAGGYYSGVATLAPSGQFASELRHWRSARRWSQLELALRADTTQRHLSYIEQGRSRPGRTMVARLAESLGLSLRERNALLHAAGYAPIFPESGHWGRHIVESLRAHALRSPDPQRDPTGAKASLPPDLIVGRHKQT